MYRISIWLKGGGKIVEECDINEEKAQEILFDIKDLMTYNTIAAKRIYRNTLDELPIVVNCKEIAAIQIDENKKKEYRGRKLDTNL